MSNRYSVEVDKIGKRYQIGSMPTMYRTFRETVSEKFKKIGRSGGDPSIPNTF